MVFKVPAAKPLTADQMFEFTMPGSKRKFAIPLGKYLAPSFVVILATQRDVRATKAILDEYAPGAFELFRSSEQIDAFSTAWREASGIGLGESSASSSS